MSRYARKKSNTGYYHIIIRGVNRQDIFFDDDDRQRFIDTIKRFQEELNIQIVAYCLMSNHVHILLYANEELSIFVKKMSSSYVFWFNRKYGRVGHLFQDRFKSEAIDSDSYLMTAMRYILHNPQKAGICPVEKYKWSSFSEIEKGGFCDIKKPCEIAGNKNALLDFICADNEDQCMDMHNNRYLSEQDVIAMVINLSGLKNPLEVSHMEKDKQNLLFWELKKNGASIRQLSRITGVNRNVIQRACPPLTLRNMSSQHSSQINTYDTCQNTKYDI